MDKNRKTAYLTLLDVEEQNAYSNLAVNERIRQECPDSPPFVRELVYGVLENKYYLDYIIACFVKKLSSVKGKEKTLLRMGLYQMIFMESVPAYAAVSETVALAKRFCRGKDGFINGVLRRYDREGASLLLPDAEKEMVRYLSVKYSYEPWIIDLWIGQFGREEAELLLAAGNETPELALRVNRLKTTRGDLKELLQKDGVNVHEGCLAEESLLAEGSGVLDSALYEQGYFSVQDQASMLAVCQLDPQPGEFVIDVCAAPGGKTGFIAERMRNQGMVLAGDFYEQKLALIKKQMQRLGIEIVQTRQWNAAEADQELNGRADRVLVDAPCSGLGVIRRKPEIKYKQEQMLKDLSGQQLQILKAASGYVRAGGVLVYSTCTISQTENQNVVKQFLDQNKDFTKIEERQLLPHVDHTDGFYICKMIRN